MRLLICAGGTGGGVYPALAVLQVLNERSKAQGRPLDVLWVGGEGGMETDLVKRAGIPFEAIPAAGLHGVGLKALPSNLKQLGRGYFAARRILLYHRPQALFFTGGYLAGPVAVAARLLPSPRPSALVYVPDIEPGQALKALGRFATHIAVTAEESRQFFHGHAPVQVTGYPTRPDLRTWQKDDAFRALGLSPDIATLLVYGGSKGAHSINQALVAALPALLPHMQIVHLTGQGDWHDVDSARRGLPPEQAARYRAYPYLHTEMGAALSAADLVVSRAGASSLGEFPAFGLPAVLVPYPYAWRYQQVNADYLARRGAALVLPDADLPARLASMVQELMLDRPRRERMQQAMRALACPAAAAQIAALLEDLAGQTGQS